MHFEIHTSTQLPFLKKLKMLDATSEDTLLHTHMQMVGLFPREALFAKCAEMIARRVLTLRFIGMARAHARTHWQRINNKSIVSG